MAPPKPTPKTSTSSVIDQPSGTPMDQYCPLTPDDVVNPGGQETTGPSSNSTLPAWCPDLNPMDFSVWRMLERKIGGNDFATVDYLKTALKKAWANIDDEYLSRVVDSVRKRLRACIKYLLIFTVYCLLFNKVCY
uniref:Uncharacterized protein n=1 Tax=Caenorhabditis japonica TaxID=281687 RepID=A0A8R1I5L1_CAEJA